MKGIPLLAPIDEPVEGMQVVWGADGHNPATIDTIVRTNIDFNGGKEMVALKKMYLLPFNKSELKQIVIEYLENGYGDITHTLPLHPSDWEKALPLIGQEVEFNVQYGGFQTRMNVAKLILPKQEEYFDAHLGITPGTNGKNHLRKGDPVLCSSCGDTRNAIRFKITQSDYDHFSKCLNNSADKQEESWDSVFSEIHGDNASAHMGIQKAKEFLEANFHPPKPIKQ